MAKPRELIPKRVKDPYGQQISAPGHFCTAVAVGRTKEGCVFRRKIRLTLSSCVNSTKRIFTYGYEIVAYLDYVVTGGLNLTLGGGYLLADKDLGAGDDAWRVGYVLNFKF